MVLMSQDRNAELPSNITVLPWEKQTPYICLYNLKNVNFHLKRVEMCVPIEHIHNAPYLLCNSCIIFNFMVSTSGEDLNKDLWKWSWKIQEKWNLSKKPWQALGVKHLFIPLPMFHKERWTYHLFTCPLHTYINIWIICNKISACQHWPGFAETAIQAVSSLALNGLQFWNLMSWATIGFSRTSLLHGVLSRDCIMQNILFWILMIFMLCSFAGLDLGMYARRLWENNAENVWHDWKH